MTIDPALDRFQRFALDLALRSADVITSRFLAPDLTVDTKTDSTPVTEADRDAEELMRALIAKEFPDHGIVGEEFGSERADSEFVWILDPIDGTRSFVAGCPLFGTLIGLTRAGVPLLGVIHQPVLKQLMWGDGTTTHLNGTPVTTRRRELSESLVLATDITHVARYRDEAPFRQLIGDAETFRTWGDCYGYMLVARGLADVMLDPIVNSWDIIPVIPVLRGAGGVITDWTGGDPVSASSAVAAASTELHSQVIQLLNPKTSNV